MVKNPLANTGAESPSLVQEDVPRDSSARAPQPTRRNKDPAQLKTNNLHQAVVEETTLCWEII